ncbi:Lipid A export ATP-binding/permease protein MsbA [Paramagnetospirillum magnetotacticum MS-1]|uniref:Lipid A export ATP-binding/permease protein MsbA n=1 Tax=Paramagnetospirillum magnetotacticum MS-1 TaxID=272627 RepID=A0A0C2YZV8_PARME|nr:ABC transporter ATP-binding protein/permease [Paramagnetospirillum magnetotacticum]KIM00614.1 Lipid A export ATP-binding/permease protein MsbA [Paramagnetospirillum magnetotacticum MS-1]
MRRRDPSSWDKGRGQGASADWSTLRTLFPYLWPPGEPRLRLRVVVAMILLVAAKGVGVGIPLLYKQAVDALSVQPILVPLALLAAYGAARVMAGSFAELRDIVFVKVAQRAIRKVGLGVFTHLHRLGLRFHLDRQTGGVSRAIERGTKGIEFLLQFMLFNILPTLLEIGLVTAILWGLYDGIFALITVCTIAVYIAFTLGITEWRTKFRRAMNETDSEASTKAIDSLLNFETVKYFCNEAHEAGRYDKALARYEQAASKSKVTLSMLNMGQGAVIAIGLTLVMIRAAQGVADGTMTLGDFVLVNSYLIQLYLPLNFLGFVYREIKQSLTDMESMFRLLRENAEIEDAPHARPLELNGGAVRFENVVFGYNPDRGILGGVDFSVPAGHTLAIVGPSGAGKSTISRLLFRFYDVNGGRIVIDGTDIRDVTQGSLRAAIGIVPQDTVLFNDSIRYNIAYGRPGASQDEIEQAARLARIHDFVQSLPQGYDTKVGERGLKLSGGEKQRVAIARTILKQPAILIFDEATSALDTQTEKEIQESLREVSKNRTTLIVAHRLSTVVDADEIVVLEQGRIVERGRHAQLLDAQGSYAAMWRRQQEAQSLQQRLATELVGAE